MNIRIVSPSAHLKEEYIYKTVELLQSWGHTVSLGKYALSQYRGFAGTPAERAADLNEAFSDPEVDVILCSRGGYGLAQIIDKVQVNPNKVLVGFSDITCLHSLLGTQNIPSLHAVMAKHLGTCPSDDPAALLLRETLQGADIQYHLPAHPLNRMGQAKGTMRGGNLCVFSGLHGTPYDLNLQDDTILFIEDIGEPLHNLDRLFQTLRLAGSLNKIKALIIGQLTDCKEDADIAPTIHQIIVEAMADTDCPIVFDFPAGHVVKNYPIWMNREAELNVTPTGTTFYQKGYKIKI